MELHGDIYVRTKFKVQPSDVIDISGDPTYVCDSCGRICPARNTPIRVKAGVDQWHGLEYQVCPSCVKARALENLKADYPLWYIRLLP